MKVIAAINGTITAESMAFFALKYAQIQNLTLLLLHIENKKDDLNEVEASMDRITMLATSQNIQTERAILKGPIKKTIRVFLSNNFADIIFCSTRKEKNFITNSFSLLLTKLELNIDIAIVRIVTISNVMDVSNVILSIKKDRLSVKKFTFFSTLASAYGADGEIYSLTGMSKFELSKIGIHEVRERLSLINYNLRHYIKLSNIMNFTLSIKHDFTNNEAQKILSHIVKSKAQLVVVGAKRLTVTSFFKQEMPIETLMREASINTIAYYPYED